jgi:phosphopantetheine adenylyltransferase
VVSEENIKIQKVNSGRTDDGRGNKTYKTISATKKKYYRIKDLDLTFRNSILKTHYLTFVVSKENIKIQKVNSGRTDDGRPVVANAHMTLRVR